MKTKLIKASNESVTIQQELVTDIFNYRSKELFINLDREKDIPPLGHKDRPAFVLHEKTKCREGVNINGVHIWGTLYYHICHHKIQLDDSEDEFGRTKRIIRNPDLRDNDWIIHEEYNRALKEHKGYAIASARQIGKTDTLVSLTSRELFLFPNTEAMVIFGSAVDKQSFAKKMRVVLVEGERFIVIPSIDKDWKKTEIRFGFTQTDNVAIEYSKLYLYNAEDGNNSEVGAGKSLTFFAMDEIGKYPFLSAWTAVEPALTDRFGNYRNAPFFCFTGGEAEKATQAFNFLLNPKGSNLLAFETENKQTARFLDAGYRQDSKVEIPFTQFLNNENIPHTKAGDELKKMKIWVADREAAIKKTIEKLEEKKAGKDTTEWQKYRAYYPLKLADVLSKIVKNTYPIRAIEEHLEYLRANPRGVGYDFYRDVRTGEAKIVLSDKKEITQFPLDKGVFVDEDSPVMIYDMPKYNVVGLHVIGADPYRDDETLTSNSLGAFSVGRRNHSDLKDPFRTKQVASYAGRPKTAKEYYQKLELVADFYQAYILYEHTDRALLDYFETRHKAHLLISTIPLQRTINHNSKSMNSKGLRPTVPNQTYLRNTELSYLTEEMEDDTMGVVRVNDIMLLEEYLAYDGEINTDRIIGFQHMVAALRYYDQYGTVDTVEEEITEEDKKRQKQESEKNVFGYYDRRDLNVWGIR